MTEMSIEQALQWARSLHRSGQLAEAERIYRDILRCQPAPAWPASIQLAVLLQQTGRTDEGIEILQRMIATIGDAPELHYAVGTLLKQSARPLEAVVHFQRAIELRPDYPAAWTNLGDTYRELNRMEDARQALEQAVQLTPLLAEAQYNLGVVHYAMGRWDQALAAFERAIAARPDFAEAHLNRAIVWLLQGDFERGLPEYEYRYAMMPARPPPGAMRWKGEDLAGKTLLVEMEQGYGDAIQFVCYVPLLAERGAKVVLRVADELVELMRHVSGAHQVVSLKDSLPPFDYHIFILSLPLALGTRMGTIPNQVPYIRAPQRDFKLQGQVKVGLCWGGSPKNPDSVNKSVPPQVLAKLRVPPQVTLYSLQKRVTGWPLHDKPPLLPMIDFTEDLRDFADTAGLIDKLDLVISMDTAVLHLAGALAKRAWGLIPFSPSDWRFFLDRSDSPWYPTMRLFRQPAKDRWEPVIEQVSHALAEFVDAAQP